jgi:hypothetical protein
LRRDGIPAAAAASVDGDIDGYLGDSDYPLEFQQEDMKRMKDKRGNRGKQSFSFFIRFISFMSSCWNPSNGFPSE